MFRRSQSPIQQRKSRFDAETHLTVDLSCIAGYKSVFVCHVSSQFICHHLSGQQGSSKTYGRPGKSKNLAPAQTDILNRAGENFWACVPKLRVIIGLIFSHVRRDIELETRPRNLPSLLIMT